MADGMDKFGKRFRECRKAAGLTQVAAAKLMGIGNSSLSEYENDVSEPTASVIYKMAETYGCSIDHLLGLDTPENGLIMHTIYGGE